MELGSIFDTLVPINVFDKKPTLGVIGNQMSYGAKIKKEQRFSPKNRCSK